MKEARRKAEQMELYLEEMKKTYADIMTFFGDDNTDESARREFFTKLANFVNEYKVSLIEFAVTTKTFANFISEIAREEHFSGRNTTSQ
jgi:hypothetical protein